MKMKFLILTLVLCLTVTVLCACGNKTVSPTDGSVLPSEDVSATSPAETESTAEPTDKGLFVTESDDIFITFPEEFQGIELPEDVFGEDVTGIFESHPIDETTEPPQQTEPAATEQEESEETPVPTLFNPDVLPEDVFED